jgi:hypothetical protein
MADEQDEGTRDLSKQNPFRMPTDEEIFSLRDEERARKEEVSYSLFRSPHSFYKSCRAVSCEFSPG